MCRSVLQIVKATGDAEGAEPIQTFNKNKKIVAQKDVVVSAPWVVLQSQQYEGRYFFFNTETKKSEWTLDEKLCIKEYPTIHQDEKVDNSINVFRGCEKNNSSETTSIISDSSNEESVISSAAAEEIKEKEVSVEDVVVDMIDDEENQVTVVPNKTTFSVLDGLGQGGYATVVKVQHNESGQSYAMKVISKSKVNEKHKSILAFELQVMTETTPSPFLQRCHLAFENQYNIYFILDMHTGGDLFHHLLQKCQSGSSAGLEEKELQIILAEVYLALEHLHNHNIIHRDIKIENIMLDGNGHVKLIDFGLSKQLSSPIEKMSPAGSLIYMSPELILENTGGRHTDWWAYGVMAFELLTGRTPWSSLTNPQIIKHEIETVNVNKFLTDFSPQVSSFICSLMNINFMERLGTRIDSDIMNDPFFTSIDWEATKLQETEPALYPDHICTSEEARHSSLELYHKISSPQQNDQGGERSWNMGLEHSDNYLV